MLHCIWHYRDLYCPMETCIDWSIDNAWAADDGIISVEVTIIFIS